MNSFFVRNGDFWSGLALAALGGYIVSQAWRWDYLGEDGPGAGFFPMWYGGAMVVLSLLLAAGAILKARPPKQAFQWHDLGRALLCWAAFVGCIASMPLLGFPISFALLTWFIIAVMARQPQPIALGVAIGAAAAFYVLFTLALDLSLPKGMLF
jgi:putative tricarboxylic transport membrane protein